MNANDVAARGNVEAIAAALEAYQISHGTYAEALSDLTNANPPYLSENFADGKHQGYDYFIFMPEAKNRYAVYTQPDYYGVSGTNFLVCLQGGLSEFDDYNSAIASIPTGYSSQMGIMPLPPEGYEVPKP